MQPLEYQSQAQQPLGEGYRPILEDINAKRTDGRKRPVQLFSGRKGDIAPFLFRKGILHKFDSIRQSPKLLEHPFAGGGQAVFFCGRRIAGFSRICPANIGQSIFAAYQLELA